MISLDATVEARVYLGVMTQITVRWQTVLRLVALEQAWHRARAEDRWERGMKIRIGWRPEHCRVLRWVDPPGRGHRRRARRWRRLKRLERVGAEIEVLEARELVGGRTWSQLLPNER